MSLLSPLVRKALSRIFGYAPTPLLRRLLFRLIGVKVGKNTYLPWGIWIGPKSFIGANVKLGRGCRLGTRVLIGDGSILYENSFVGNHVSLGKDVTIGAGALVANASVGNGSHIEKGVIFTGFTNGEVLIGCHTYVGINNVIDWSGGVKIGNYVHIAGPSTALWTHTSVNQALLGDELQEKRFTRLGSIGIADFVWIGGNCTLYPNVEIGTHVVVVPNTVVNKSVENNSMVGGCPAKLIRHIRIKEGDVFFELTGPYWK